MSNSTRALIDVTVTAGSEDEPQPAERVAEDAFRATGTQWQFGEVLVSDLRLEASAHGMRSQTPDRYPQERAVNVVFVLEGAAHVTLQDATFIFVAGAGVVLPSNELPPFFCTEPSRVLVVSLAGPDARELSGLIPERPTAIAAAVIATHPTLGFLLALMSTARQHPIRTPPAGAIIAKLVASLLDADHDWHTRPNHPRVAEVLALIDQRHADPTFDTKALARHLHTTPREIELLFLDVHGGQRPSDILLERRLVAAMTLLHPGTSQTAEEIATRSGFTSAGHLDTAIDGVYGLDTKTLLAL